MSRSNCERSIALPVVGATSPSAGPIRPSRVGKWRAASLIGVHVLIALHVLHWNYAGRTLSPVEPSESMETLWTGRVNAGALFFAAALLTTLIFGRWVCGWACHVVAVQDLCTWLLKKVGFRPKPFRSRLLAFVPFLAAVYMFGIPFVDRLMGYWIGRVGPPSFTNHLMKADFWGTFPGPIIAVLTLVICGFGIVYFLGNKGFCTYACPYGGFFGVLDRLAPMRVRVTDACNHCGHCTAVCTSNVRVADEVKAYGMVVDPGCMKCTDCVSVCPNDALYVGFGRPALGTRPATVPRSMRYDGHWAEELGLAVVFVASLFAYRGLYGQIPFLFSLGLSAITSYLTLKAWHALMRRDVSMHRLVLKRRGRLQRAGFGYLVAYGLLALFVAHSGIMQYCLYRGMKSYKGTTSPVGGWQFAGSLAPIITPSESSAADETRSFLHVVDRWGAFYWSDANTALAWLDVLRDDMSSAERRVRREIDAYPSASAARESLAAVLTRTGRKDEALEAARRAVELSPTSPSAHCSLGMLLQRRGDAAEAAKSLAEAIELSRQPENAEAAAGMTTLVHAYYAEALRQGGRLDDALGALAAPVTHGDQTVKELELALKLDRKSAGLWRAYAAVLAQKQELSAAEQIVLTLATADRSDYLARMLLARIRMQSGDPAGALVRYAEAERIAPQAWTVQFDLASALALMRRFDDAVARARRAAELKPTSAMVRANIGAVLVSKGELAAATAEYREAARLAPADFEYPLRIGMLLGMQGQRDEAAAVLRGVAACNDPALREAAKAELAKLNAP